MILYSGKLVAAVACRAKNATSGRRAPVCAAFRTFSGITPNGLTAWLRHLSTGGPAAGRAEGKIGQKGVRQALVTAP
jgi:hypothetical protein